MDYLASDPQFNTLSLPDLLRARDQFHPHLMHKANVVGTAVGRYLIRKSDPYPSRARDRKEEIDTSTNKRVTQAPPKPARTLENSEVRDYSWGCVLVFVSKWEDPDEFGAGGKLSASDYIPKTIYLGEEFGGRSVPVCVVWAPLVEEAPPPIDPAKLTFPDLQISGGYPVIVNSQGEDHYASLGCLLTDGHTIYALTSRHVTGRPNTEVSTILNGKKEVIGKASDKQLGRLPFEQVYNTWAGKHIYVNADVGLIEIDDVKKWSPSIFGIGQLGPLADLSIYNLTLNLIGCPVRAYGMASGRMYGKISALFYRYKSVGGFEYVADFLVGSRVDNVPLQTRPGDSGTVWVLETENPERDLMPIAVQWGGTVFSNDTSQFPFALATNLSTVCRELEVDLFRSRKFASFDYWGAVGHYTIAAFACQEVMDPHLKKLMMANQDRVSFKPNNINPNVDDTTVPGFVPLADVPDKVWKKAISQYPFGRKGAENPNHYADIDLPNPSGDTLDTLTPDAASLVVQTWIDYYRSIGWNLVSQRGLLPFRVWQIYRKMVDYVQAQDVASFVAAAGVLSHYIGDACQPLHGSYLDDGDPFRHPDGTASAEALPRRTGYGNGVHTAFEEDMFDDNTPDLLLNLPNSLNSAHGMATVTGGQEAGFAIIELMRRVRQTLPPMNIVNAYGAIVDNGDSRQAGNLLWQSFDRQTVDVMADGCRTLAMIWDSAWAEGGGNYIPASQLKAIPKQALQTIYENQDFLPSKALGKVQPYL